MPRIEVSRIEKTTVVRATGIPGVLEVRGVFGEEMSPIAVIPHDHAIHLESGEALRQVVTALELVNELQAIASLACDSDVAPGEVVYNALKAASAVADNRRLISGREPDFDVVFMP